MLTGQVRVEYGWIVYLLSVGWCAAVAAQGLDPNLPYKGSVSQHNGPTFQIENEYRCLLKPGDKPSATGTEQASAILGQYSYSGTYVTTSSPELPKLGTTAIPLGTTAIPNECSYKNVGKLGGYGFGVLGICEAKDGYGVRAENTAIGGTGLYVKGGPNGAAAMFDGSIVLGSKTILPSPIWGGQIHDGLGFWGTQGSWRSSWTWNYYRNTQDNHINVLGVNGFSNVAGIELGYDGIVFRAKESASNGDDPPPVRMVVSPTGHVGIGTTTPPAAGLHILANAQNLRMEGTDHVYIEFYPDGPTTRKGWLGYGSPTDNNLSLSNEISGAHIILSPKDGNVGIGTNSPSAKLHVEGDAIVRGNLKIVSPTTDKTLLEFVEGFASIGGRDHSTNLDVWGDAIVRGNLKIVSPTTDHILIEFGEGLDYAEGFDVSDNADVGPGAVLVIDPQNPGNLTVSTTVYDTKVAGIVAGAKGLGSGVRLGTGQCDHDVALAGRVYCNVDTTESAMEPGDLLTTSATAGYAMKVSDHLRAQGAILGKAMERLEKGQRAQILVLVTLQ